MNTASKIILTLLALMGSACVLCLLGLLMAYNSTVALSAEADRRWADVQNVCQRRADLIPNLVGVVKGAADFEQSTLDAVTQARASVGQLKIDASQAPKSAEQLARFQAAQNGLSQAISRLLVVTENYPELKANANFRDLQAQLEGTENRISVERGKFNEAVREYNTQIKSVPSVLFAAAAGFEPKSYFNADVNADKAPVVSFK